MLFSVYHSDSGRRSWGAGPGDPSEDEALLTMLAAQRVDLDAGKRLA